LDRVEKRLQLLQAPKQWEQALTAIRSYERGDTASVDRDILLKHPEFEAVGLFPAVLKEGGPATETDLARLARPSCAWGEIVAIDAALNHGRLDLAEHMVERWPSSYQSRAHLQRLARLRRYQGSTDDAINLAEAATYGNATRQQVTERVLALLKGNDDAGAAAVVAQQAPHLGPLRVWLGALVTAPTAPKTAKRLVAPATLPGEGAVLSDRIVAALALARSGDPRATEYVERLAELVPDNPDLAKTGLVQ
jgi:hypothetical protein